MENKVLKIGHRGAAGYEPENTLASFKKALELGVDSVELDVHVCKTGELVVIHDDKVDRTTNGAGYVEEKTLKELKTLDAGKGQKIPTLKEVLDLVDKKVIVNIELKGPNTAEPVADLINFYILHNGWTEELFLVSSFDHAELLEFKKLNPNIKIGVLIEKTPESGAKFAQDSGVYSVNISGEYVDQKFVADAHNKGLKVLVWTTNDTDNKDNISKIKDLGVDGIFSNFPDKI